MALAPLNFVHSLQLVPVFKWEPVEVSDPTAPAPPPLMAFAIDGVPPPPAQTPSATTTDLRLVFKGFQWRPVADCVHFPRPNWESCFAGAADEESELQQRDRRAQLEQSRRVKPTAPVAPSPEAHHTSDPPEPN
jgi:hypothetical protein